MTRVLVASRGAMAVRVIAACRQRGWSPVAVAAVSDQQRVHVAAADDCIDLGGRTAADTYECAESIAAAAAQCRADLVHPGCGALAENADLARRLDHLGIGLAGSQAGALALASDKGRTVATAARLGIPVLPHATTRDRLGTLVARAGLPLVVKPADGCLGRGVCVARSPAELERALAAYADGGWYAERYVAHGTVVAVTVAVDAAGTACELGERETLLLAGSFKLLDASPGPTVPPQLMTRMRRDTRLLVTAMGLAGVVACEFIVGSDGYFLLETNPRLSGGFRMCEAQTGLDLVSLQLDIAQGGVFGAFGACGERPVVDRGVHCLEARWYLRPEAVRTSVFERLRFTAVPGVTYDYAIEEDRSVEFDTIVAQLLATGPDRRVAADRLLRAAEGAQSQGLPHYGYAIADWLRAAEFAEAT